MNNVREELLELLYDMNVRCDETIEDLVEDILEIFER